VSPYDRRTAPRRIRPRRTGHHAPASTRLAQMSDLTPRDPDAEATAGAVGRPALRASDADRERVADLLRQAGGDGRLDVDELEERLQQVYRAKTVTELRPLIADLTPEAVIAHPGGGVTVRPGEGGTGAILSIMGGNDRKGRWRVAKHCLVINIMGGSDLDLNQAELSDREVTITVFSMMGGSEIYVPKGVDVRVTKLGLMGGNDVELDDATPLLGAPVIHLRLLSIMGGTDVKQGPKLSRAERKRQKELRRAAERGQLER
jgi:hypothetical protein